MSFPNLLPFELSLELRICRIGSCAMSPWVSLLSCLGFWSLSSNPTVFLLYGCYTLNVWFPNYFIKYCSSGSLLWLTFVLKFIVFGHTDSVSLYSVWGKVIYISFLATLYSFFPLFLKCWGSNPGLLGAMYDCGYINVTVLSCSLLSCVLVAKGPNNAILLSV